MPRGPLPKDPAIRRRRNKPATSAELPSPDDPEVLDRKIPPLNAQLIGLKRGAVLPQVREYWRDIWRSPMASRWLASDLHGLYRCAALQQAFYKAMGEGRGAATIAAEIRQQEMRFGLSPIDRRRLDWKITAPAENPASEANVIRLVAPDSRSLAEDDPRLALHSESQRKGVTT